MALTLLSSFRDGAKRHTRNPDMHWVLAPGLRVRGLGPSPGLTGSELHRRSLFQLGAFGTGVEELARLEAQRSGEQHRGELLDAGIVFLHRVVEEAACRGDLVFEIGQLRLQLLEI